MKITRDFSHTSYKKYILALKKQIGVFLRFDEFIPMSVKPDAFCLIRHDVDRKPKLALEMAEIEYKHGIKSTYYFRAKPCSYDIDLMKKISALGHEIGYHYESLADTNGDIPLAVKDFERNLDVFRKTVPINTVSMHGSPLKPFDNRDIWRIKENHAYLKSQLGIAGEVYLDIDYTDIAYINDTGRNWTSGKSNRRDKVISLIEADFESGEALLSYLSGNSHKKVCFQIHPERWSDEFIEWHLQYVKDEGINLVKNIISRKP